MRFGKWIGVLAGSALIWAMSATLATSAIADTLTLGTGSVFDIARGCTTVSCGSGTQTLGLASPAAAGGSISLDTGSMTLDFEITALSILLKTPMGDDDNGVVEIEFVDTTYSGTDVMLLSLGGGNFLVFGGQEASVTGSQIQRDAGNQATSASGAFENPNARVTGTCQMTGDNLFCGLSFGMTGFDLTVGDGFEETRYFQHTVDFVAVVPEPQTLAMLFSALGLARIMERRRQ